MAKKLTLDELEQKRDAIQARILSEKAKLRTRDRKRENRRKVLAGAAVLYHWEQDAVFKATVMKMIDGFLARDDERAVFDLPPRQAPQAETDARRSA